MIKNELEVSSATIATVTTTLGFMQSQLAEIKADLKSLQSTFASKEELAQTARDVEIRLAKLENSSNLWKFLSPTFSAALAAIITFFVLEYIKFGK